MSSLHRRDLGVSEQYNSSCSIDLITWMMAERSVSQSSLLYAEVGYCVSSKAICPVPCVLPKTNHLNSVNSLILTHSSARAVYATDVFFPRQQFLPHKLCSRHALETMQMDLEGNPQAFSSVFTNRRSSFFDSGLSTWYDPHCLSLARSRSSHIPACQLHPMDCFLYVLNCAMLSRGGLRQWFRHRDE